ncbi:hypothetical protein IKA92_04085 [bacterium]|nr:hypothetical protein [bacterium]
MTAITDYSGFIGEVWSKKINASLDKTCCMLQCVNRDWQADADKGVKKINIITPTTISASDYTGAISDYGTMSTTPTVLELSQKIYFGITIPDVAEVQSNVSILDTVVESAKKGIEQKIDSYLFSQYTSTDAENQLGSTENAVEVTKENIYAQFVALAKKLKISGAIDASNPGWVVVHPDVEELILLSDSFTKASEMADKATREGAIGKIAGLDVFVSNNVGKNSDHYVVLAGTQKGITYASQLSKIETLRAESSFNSIVRGLYMFGGMVVNPAAIATLTCTIG